MEVFAPFDPTRERVRVPWFAAATYVLLTIAAATVMFGDPDLIHSVAPIGILVGDVVAGVVFIRRAQRLTGLERRAWTLVGIGLITATSGIAVLALQIVIVGNESTFGASDAFFIVGYVIILTGIASLPHVKGDRLQQSRMALDAIIGAVSVGALFWVLFLSPIMVALDGAPLTDRVFGVLYPLVDVAVIIVVMIVTIRRSLLRYDIRLLLFIGAVLLQGIADVSYLVEGVGQSFTEAEPLFVAYLAAAALFLTTALVVDHLPRAREYADRRVPVWSMIIPYTAALGMVLALLHRLWDTELDPQDRVLLVAAIAVAILVVVRQGISIRENRKIVEQQRVDLVSSISHELRTPLTAMVGFLAVLQGDQRISPAERSEMIDVVAEQAMFLERIVQDLLAVASDGSDRMALNVSEHNVAAVIDSALRSTPIDGSTVTVEVEPGLVAIVDGGRLQLVLVNLLSNAARYGGGECLVAAYAERGVLVIEVHDSGPGVPKKHEITIWEQFERGPNRYNANLPGSGIGLAMVKNVAESHGGQATYRRSNRLGGACFVIDLPGRVGKTRPIAIVSASTMAIG